MKTSLLLLSILFCIVAVDGTVLGQPAGSESPGNSPETNNAFTKVHSRQPSSPPDGGFWVVENTPDTKRLTLVHYYTDQRVLLQTDTLAIRSLNLKRRPVVDRLNQRLLSLLVSRPVNRPELAGPKIH